MSISSGNMKVGIEVKQKVRGWRDVQDTHTHTIQNGV